MARREAPQIDLDPPQLEPAEPAPEPSPRKRARGKSSETRAGWGRKIKRVFICIGAGAAVVGVVAGAYQADEFLASNSHFLLAGANLTIQGVVYTPRADVMQVFQKDIGRSVYLTPLSERRHTLLALDWIRDATVSRRWPNRLDVRIVERTPVAFAILPSVTADGWAISEAALIDAEGVILRPPARAHFSLPALVGVSRRDTPAARRAGVEKAVELIREVQAYAGQISEIDVSDQEDLNITEVAQGRPLRLRLGNRNYLSRLSCFLSHYPDIGRRLPNARTFDLRLDDHITAQDGGPDGR